MSDQVQSEELATKFVECYLCESDIPVDKALDIPLTTGGKVKVHASCLDFYMSQATLGASCGGCSGDAGCCG